MLLVLIQLELRYLAIVQTQLFRSLLCSKQYRIFGCKRIFGYNTFRNIFHSWNIKHISIRTSSQIVLNPLAPVLLASANHAISCSASSSKCRLIPSLLKSIWYSFTIESSGSVRIRTRSSSLRSSKVMRIGRRPTNSCISPYFMMASWVIAEDFSSLGPTEEWKPIGFPCLLVVSKPEKAPPQIGVLGVLGYKLFVFLFSNKLKLRT